MRKQCCVSARGNEYQNGNECEQCPSPTTKYVSIQNVQTYKQNNKRITNFTFLFSAYNN